MVGQVSASGSGLVKTMITKGDVLSALAGVGFVRDVSLRLRERRAAPPGLT